MNDVQVFSRSENAGSDGGENVVSLVGAFKADHPYTIVRLEDGRLLKLETSQLLAGLAVETVDETKWHGASGDYVIPLVEEKLHISKRTITTGTVRLHKSTDVYTESLDEVLAVRTFEVERIRVDLPVEAVPAVRQEGNVTIYPVVEEQLVLTKQLILREEVRVVQVDGELRDTRVVTLRKEHLTVERENPKQSFES